MTYAQAKERARKTFLKRFGPSTMPLEFLRPGNGSRVLVIDPESNRRAEYEFSGRKLVRTWDNEGQT